jgi:hypothetical protein
MSAASSARQFRPSVLAELQTRKNPSVPTGTRFAAVSKPSRSPLVVSGAAPLGPVAPVLPWMPWIPCAPWGPVDP